MEDLEEGAKRAGVELNRITRNVEARGLENLRRNDHKLTEVANMAALVIINAMIFQERLASNEMAFAPVSRAGCETDDSPA